MRVAFERQDVGRDAIQEPAVMRDDEGVARELQQRIFQRTQGFDVQVVGRFVEQQHVATLQQGLGHVQAATLTTGQRTDHLLLVLALEVEAADVGARLDLDAVDVEDVQAARDFLEDVVVAFQRVAALVHVGQLHGRADNDLAGVRLFLAGDHLEQGRLTGTVRADDADDGAGRHQEAQVVEQQAVAELLGDVLELHHRIAQALARRDEDFIGLVALLVIDRLQLFQAGQAGLALGAAALGVLARPLQFLLDRLLASLFLVVFLLQALILLGQPVGVVALPRNAAAAVQFQDPLGGVVQEVAIMGDRHDGAGVARQELFQPLHRLGVEVVGRFVEQQHVRLLQQQAAQRHAALLTTGQLSDHGIPRRQAQCIGGHVQLVFQGVRVAGGQDRLQALLFLGQRVEVGAFLGIGQVHRVQRGLGLQHFAHAFLDRFTHGLGRVQFRFLRQVANLDARLRARFALEIGVHAGHDLQHGGLAGAVQAQQADLRAREEGQRDVLDDLPLGRDHLGHAVHGVDVLRGHEVSVGAALRPVRHGNIPVRQRAQTEKGVPPIIAGTGSGPRRAGGAGLAIA